jgi:hypothetical protein
MMGIEKIFEFADDFITSLPGQFFVPKSDLEFDQSNDDEIIHCEVQMKQEISMIPFINPNCKSRYRIKRNLNAYRLLENQLFAGIDIKPTLKYLNIFHGVKKTS